MEILTKYGTNPKTPCHEMTPYTQNVFVRSNLQMEIGLLNTVT